MRGETAIQKANALVVRCEYCGSQPGNECFDPRTGFVLEHQPAHFRRLQDAQVVR